MMRRVLLGGLLASLLLASPASVAAGSSISYSPASPTTTSGVSFTVTTGGGNREFASVSVTCTVGTDVVYATILTVSVPSKGTGTSATIYPPASSCVADLVKLMSIGKARVLATTSFDVTEAP